jgi:phosphohistidine swiveling domain-containing protein
MNTQDTAEPACALHVISDPNTRWSRVNAVESFPGVARPLSWDLFGTGTNLTWRRMFEALGLVRPGNPLPANGDAGYLRPFYGRSSINIEITMACMSLFPGDKASDHARELFSETGGHWGDGPDRSGIDLERHERYKSDLPTILAEEHARLLAWWKVSLAGLEKGTVDPARLFLDAAERYVSAQANHSANSTLCQQYFSAASKLAQDADRPDLATRLTTGFGDTFDTRSMGFLWDVGRGKRTLADYLADFGFQTSQGDDIFVPSWRENDAPLRALLKSFAKLGDDASPLLREHARVAERQEAEAVIIAALPQERREEARSVFDRLAQSTRDREMGKASYKIALDVGRAAARARGGQLHAQGFLDDPQDVFFLDSDEAMERSPTDFRSLIAIRKAAHARYEAITIPDAWQGNPQPMAAGGALTEGPVSGLGVSGGVATGRVRLVIDHESAEDMEPGDILVTRTTDPSWGPFFMVAGGLVIDVGGAMSHGAIIARELGIPCVINTKDGTRRLADGVTAEVDGDAGTVRVVG